MIKLSSKGDWKKTTSFLSRMQNDLSVNFDAYGKKGVTALQSSTPVDTGKTASSWYYKVEKEKDKTKLVWYNSNVNKGVNIAMIIQLGHGTRNGVYVHGIDYINPALKPIFDEIADKIWKEVTE